MITRRVAGEATTPIAGVRVVARDVDPSGSEPAYHATPDDEVVLAETITADDGTYRLELPRGWVGLAFEHDAWMRAYRTADTTFLRSKTQAGEAEVVLDFASTQLWVRDAARLDDDAYVAAGVCDPNWTPEEDPGDEETGMPRLPDLPD